MDGTQSPHHISPEELYAVAWHRCDAVWSWTCGPQKRRSPTADSAHRGGQPTNRP